MVYPIYLILLFVGLSQGQLSAAPIEEVAAGTRQLTIVNTFPEPFQYEIDYHWNKIIAKGEIKGGETIQVLIPDDGRWLDIHVTGKSGSEKTNILNHGLRKCTKVIIKPLVHLGVEISPPTLK